MAAQPLTSFLVVGGCGFLGHEIVRLLAQQSDCAVSVLSRKPRGPYVHGVSYHACDITDITSLRALFLQTQPTVVINTASPPFFQDGVDEALLHNVNIKGTKNLPEVATRIEATKALVHTSSNSVHARSMARFLKEDAPLVDRRTSSDEYAITKAIADTMVLEANGPNLRTLCLRPTVIYGERDMQFIPGSLAILRDKQTHIQLGDNKNLYDTVYVGNAAAAHVLAARALLNWHEASQKIDGEAFFVTDDAPIPFWDFQRKIWAAAGDQTPLESVRIIPAWVGMTMAAVVEYLFMLFTLGQKQPPKSFRRDTLRYAVTESSYCIDKAKERLEYKPLISTDEGVRRGVEWTLQHQPETLEDTSGKKHQAHGS
ncbi:MAG: hypothetical protein L6R39_002097 [Caloplaca ligustica]|nr:MAG: hypothetical protein L6R39_002097 [Caloplaca ligustica]